MIFLARNTNNTIIYLLFVCFSQMSNIHSTPVQNSDGLAISSPVDLASKAADKTKSMAQDGKKVAINGVKNVGEVLKTLVQNTGSTVAGFSKETRQSMEQVAQASGRASLAFGQLCSHLFDGLSATVATSSGYLASGVRNIDDIVGDWPVVGMVTGTLDAVTTHVANTVHEMSTNGRKSRQKMFDGLREHLNRSSGLLPSAENSSADSDSDNDTSDTTSAAVKA